MQPTRVALVFVRHAGEIFLRSAPDGAPDQWPVPTGLVGESPPEMAEYAVETGTSLEPSQVERVREGEPLDVPGDASGPTLTTPGQGTPDLSGDDGSVRIHPFLFDSAGQLSDGPSAVSWASPTTVLDPEYPAFLWQAYDRVRPTIETIASDTEHGSTTLSIRALELLRDESALLSRGESQFTSVEAVARELVTARPAMTAVSNRVLRALAAVDPTAPEEVSASAHEGIARALAADEDAAALGADRMTGGRVATLSRSGTVLKAIEMGDPSAVLVAESRPGREGVWVAEQVRDVGQTTLTSDAAFPRQLGEWGADTLLVGADSILSGGSLVNKVGTFGATLAANHHGIDVVVVAASDKIRPETAFDAEPRDRTEIAGDASGIGVIDPTFEVTPPSCIDAVVTERGILGPEEVQEIASKHAEWRALFDQDGDETR